MNVLVVFDSALASSGKHLPVLDKKDKVHLFPLTSKSSVTEELAVNIKNNGCSIEIVPVARLTNLSAVNLKDRYVKFIADIPKLIRCNSGNLKDFFSIGPQASLWWLSLVSEKNTFKSEAFNRLAQLDCIISIIKCKGIERIIFGCESKKMQIALSDYSRDNSIGFEVLSVRRTKHLSARIKELQKLFYIKHSVNLISFSMRSIFRMWKIRKKLGYLSRLPAGSNPLMIITYYPNFDMLASEDGKFRNKYYEHLQETLESRGQNIIWIVMYVQNNSISFEEALSYAEKFIKKGYIIFFLEEFNSVMNHVKVLLTMFLTGIRFLAIERNIRKAHNLNGYNFYPIFRDDWYLSFAGTAGYAGLLYYKMFRNLLDKIKTEKCLYYCEMHAWEKALIYAKRTINSDTVLFGYQHATVSPMLLNYFNSSSEINEDENYALPKPDKFICNGRIPYNLLKECGWPDSGLAIAEAIRYNNLKAAMKINYGKKKNVIIVTLSISPTESSSILIMAYEALKDIKNVVVWLKPHPFLKIESVLEVAGLFLNVLPFEVKNEPIEKLLPEARLLIVGESGVSIEALAFNCNVAIINCPEWINMSPLTRIQSRLVSNANSPEELRQTIINIFREEHSADTHEDAKKVVNDFFYLNQETDIPEKYLQVLSN